MATPMATPMAMLLAGRCAAAAAAGSAPPVVRYGLMTSFAVSSGEPAAGAAGRGANAQEVAEALGVAIMMNGGPGTVWGPRAYAAFQEYSAARQQDAD